MKDKVHAKFDKAEETRLSSHRQAEEMLAEEKEKVDEVQRLASKNMSENMAEMEENYAEVIRVTCCKMDYMEEKV